MDEAVPTGGSGRCHENRGDRERGGELTDGITRLEKKSFDVPGETQRPFDKGRIEVVTLGGLVFSRETLEPRWRWSEHVKPTIDLSGQNLL